MVVGFTTTCTCHCAYHHWSYEFESCSWLVTFDTALCDTVCQRLGKRRWFSPGTPFSSTDIKLTDYTIDIVLNDIIIYWLKIFCSREIFFFQYAADLVIHFNYHYYHELCLYFLGLNLTQITIVTIVAIKNISQI